MRFNILISSAGRRVSLLRIFKQALAGMGIEGQILAADMSIMSAAYHDADRAFQVPSCTSDDFVPAMLDLCRQNDVRLVVPTIDTELLTYATHREEFEAIGTRVSISSPEVIRICGRKDHTHAWLTEQGFPTVRQVSVDELESEPDALSFPLLVKPRGGSASIGVSVVRDLDEMRAATRCGEFIVQTLAHGIEHTVDLFLDGQGRCRCAIPRRRLEVRSGEVSKGVTVRNHRLIELAKHISEVLPGAFGVLNIQMFWDPDTDDLAVIEINPRFGGGFPLSWRAGGDYPRWLIEAVLGLPSTARQDGWRDGLIMLRFDDAVFVDAEATRVGC